MDPYTPSEAREHAESLLRLCEESLRLARHKLDTALRDEARKWVRETTVEIDCEHMTLTAGFLCMPPIYGGDLMSECAMEPGKGLAIPYGDEYHYEQARKHMAARLKWFVLNGGTLVVKREPRQGWPDRGAGGWIEILAAIDDARATLRRGPPEAP